MSKYTRAYDGWLTRYKINRPLSRSEFEGRLDVKDSISLPPIDSGLIKINSVFVECIERWFFQRGWAALGGVPAAAIWVYFLILFGSKIYTPPQGESIASLAHIIAGWYATMLCLLLVVAIFFFALAKDFFCYTHYPIRFNRINRKVYLFRHNKKNGVMTLDWDKVHWCVGRGRDVGHYIYELRGHVLDDDGIVRYTFAVGQYCESHAGILQHWEALRLYMEESPAALPYPPLALSISTRPTFRNCMLLVISWFDGYQSIKMFLFSMLYGFFRWLALSTCREPRWPSEVEAECQIPINDPYQRTAPMNVGEYPDFDEEDKRQQNEYVAFARAAAAAYEEHGSQSRAPEA
ncbi:DUF6708 domain-containing protein [Pseudomonas sp. Irchel 3E20]|uniref:DUF6708 domain-containing protein n=1 Tax=Pseudomonas sp. Irchel 3E20 TaxID=2008983 RepID=UPI0011401A25|nr:DUF6708 domain-containing protein [Pseudomonas sp. Irchel 3E20]